MVNKTVLKIPITVWVNGTLFHCFFYVSWMSGKLGFKIRVEVMEIKSMEINSAALTVIYALENNAQHN